MNKYLPIAWLTLIPVSIVAFLVGGIPILREPTSVSLFARAPGLAISGIYYGTLAAIYAVMNRVTSRRLVFKLGWAHLGCKLLTVPIFAYYWFVRHQSLASGERLDLEVTVMWTTIGSVLSALSTLAFFAAMLVAYQDTRKRIELQTFD